MNHMKYNAKGNVHFCQNQGIGKLWNAESVTPDLSEQGLALELEDK